MNKTKLLDLTKESLNLMILTLTTGSKDLMPLWFSFMLHGVDIAKLLSQSGKLLHKNSRVK